MGIAHHAFLMVGSAGVLRRTSAHFFALTFFCRRNGIKRLLQPPFHIKCQRPGPGVYQVIGHRKGR